MSSPDPISALLAVLPSLLFLGWFLWIARRAPEPPGRVLAACLAGSAAFGAAVVVLGMAGPTLDPLPLRARMFVGPAAVEESLKLGAILLAAGLPARWGRMSSGLMFSTAVALGFAAVENVAYTQQYGLETGLLRALTAVPGHALHTALIGVQLGRAHSGSGRSAVGGVALGLLLAIVAHGLYNMLLIEGALVRTAVVPLLLLEAAVLLSLLRRAREEDLAELVEMLRRMPDLAQASTPALRHLATRALRRRVAAGKRLLKQGDPSRALYLVLSGALEVQRRAQFARESETVGTIGAGEFFGEIGVLLERKRSASVVAVDDALVLELGGQGVHEAIAMIEGLAESLRGVAQDRGARSASLPSVAAIEELALREEELAARELAPDSLAFRLRAVPMLSTLRPGVLRLLEHGAETESRRAGALLLRQGGPGAGLCVLLSGTAEVLQDGAVLARLESGAWFGEISLLTGFAATATVRATSPVKLARVRAVQVRDAVGLAPYVGVELLSKVASRMAEQDHARSPSQPTLPLRLLGFARRAVASTGFARAVSHSPVAQELAHAFPQLLEMPASAAQALAELGVPPGGELRGILLTSGTSNQPGLTWLVPSAAVPDLLARSPHLLHLLARHVRSSSVLGSP